MRLKNQTGCAEAERFIRKEAGGFRTEDLAAWMKYTRQKNAAVRGYYNRRSIRIVAAVNSSAKLPLLLRYPVRTEVIPGGRFRWIYDEEPAGTSDDLMVWVFFHELHHFLCHTKQARGDWQTRANAFGFEYLRKFKARRISKGEPGQVEAAAMAGGIR